MAHDDRYDLFISYAREDQEWVRRHLYDPLVATEARDGSATRVFMDVGEHGVRQGQNFLDALSEALEKSERFVLVYSRTYFKKPMCKWERDAIFQLDAANHFGHIFPVLIEGEAEKEVPFAFKQIQYLAPFREPDWFSSLLRNLGLSLRRSKPVSSLRFISLPERIVVNHTLPPVEVEIVDKHGRLNNNDAMLT